jgi:hypothetical protein
MYDPSFGGLVISVFVGSLITEKSKSRESIGNSCFLEKFYLAPVKKDWVKKNPEIQNEAGAPLSIQS